MARSSLLAGAVILTCAAVLAAGCASQVDRSASEPAQPSSLSRAQAAHQYLAIAEAGNRRLDVAFGGLEGKDRAALAAARADLADAAATERLFDQRLAAIAFSPSTEATARLLYRINQDRAGLTASAARSATLEQLRWWQRRLDRANAAVEDAVRVIRSQLGLPPPSNS